MESGLVAVTTDPRLKGQMTQEVKAELKRSVINSRHPFLKAWALFIALSASGRFQGGQEGDFVHTEVEALLGHA